MDRDWEVLSVYSKAVLKTSGSKISLDFQRKMYSPKIRSFRASLLGKQGKV